ncbi:hypothetical protein E5E05_06860 [Helicobacter pylori]|nr:hypothetical protein [Helicobacter pylori]RVY41785.1 hypothetical protein ECC27_07835 [Helicobacter pylori]RVY81360.1 hypothetical protein ECE48_07850 [Helicobacter pylori]WQW84738.1 hypothetical protein FE366_05390 [Helicobacter pylori]WQW85007.1 hypothetical protein FE366_06945 [Helicobacter pylori]
MFFDRLSLFLIIALAYHKNSFYTLLNKTGCVLKYYNNKTERNFLKRFSQTLTLKYSHAIQSSIIMIQSS